MNLIEKNLPLSPKQTGRPRKWKQIAIDMEVGDSILVESKDFASMFGAMHKLGIKPSVRKQPDGSVRIWRVK